MEVGQTNEYYCLSCHEFTRYNREAEGNGNTGYYCSECGTRMIGKCCSQALNDLKKHHPEYHFSNNICISHDIYGCKLHKCPYIKL